MKIVVVGTSNSIIGSRGYIEALEIEHEVTQLSTGQTPFYAIMKTVISQRVLIEESDLLIIDHYVNDINFYGALLGDNFRTHLEWFYQYLSSVNANVLNLMFPIKNIENSPSIDIYQLTITLCQKYSISVIDLNRKDLPSEYFKDPIHLNHDASYALGLSLNFELHGLHLHKVSGGEINSFPFYTINGCELSTENSEPGIFRNRLVHLRYLDLKEQITIDTPKHHKLIAIGLVKDRNIEELCGFSLNGAEWAIGDNGYYLETFEEPIIGNFEFAPLSGEKTVRNLMGRGVSKGKFSYCYLVDLLFVDERESPKFVEANRQIIDFKLPSFEPIAARILKPSDSTAKLDISGQAISKLRELAISFESNQLELARDFMSLAHIARPTGKLIMRKLAEYEKKIREQ